MATKNNKKKTFQENFGSNGLGIPKYKDLKAGYIDYNPPIFKNFILYSYIRTPLFQLLCVIGFLGLNLSTFDLLSDKTFLLLTLVSGTLSIVSHITPSLRSLGLRVPDKAILVLSTLVVSTFYMSGSTFYMIYIIYFVYIINHMINLVNYKPKLKVYKMVSNQLETVRIHYKSDMWVISIFSTFSRLSFLLSLSYNHYCMPEDTYNFIYIYSSFSSVWFVTIHECLIKLGGNPFGNLFGKIAFSKGAQIAATLVLPSITTAATIYSIDAHNNINTTGSQSDFVHPKFPWFFGDAAAYQKGSNLIPYNTNLTRDLSHCAQNSDPDFLHHLLDVNGDESTKTHLPINGNMTLKEMRKFGIIMSKINGTNSSEFVYKDGIKE